MGKCHIGMKKVITYILTISFCASWGCAKPFEQSSTPLIVETLPSSTIPVEGISTVSSSEKATITATQTLIPSATQTQRLIPTDYYLPPLSGEIAFVLTERDGTDGIFIVDVNDTSKIQSFTSEGRFNHNPDWSPSGKEIVFASSRISYDMVDFDIYVKSVNGDNLQRLTSDRRTHEDDPSWSPDGTLIAFTVYKSGRGDIFIMDRNGQNRISIADTSLSETYPAWSPINDTIAYLYQDDVDSKEYHIYLMNTDGTNKRQISDLSAIGPISWSPDGRKLAVSVRNGDDLEIYVMNADGSEGYFVSNEANIDNYYPSWSPDGMYIAFDSSNGQEVGIKIVDLYGTFSKTILIDPEYGYQLLYLDWSPRITDN